MKRLKLFICIAIVLYLGICPVLTANSFLPIMQALAFLPMCVSYLLLGVHGLIVVTIVTVVSIFIGALGTSE